MDKVTQQAKLNEGECFFKDRLPILQRVNQELCNVNPKNFHDELRSAFQQLVDAMQFEHLSIAARDHGLRQFVVVWIATTLMSARVDGAMGNLADAIQFSSNRVCRVGEGACIALVSALKAAETDFRRESITGAYGGMVAQYMFSKSLDLKSVSPIPPVVFARKFLQERKPKPTKEQIQLALERQLREQERQLREQEIRMALERKNKYKQMALKIQRRRVAALVAIMEPVNEALRSAFQQLVDAMQFEHLSIAARDHGLRQFVVVWIATTLMSARVDGAMGNLADAIRFSKNRVCRVGWATEGACIALVSALKAAETDFRRESITGAYGGMVAQYSFSKTMKCIPVSAHVMMNRKNRRMFLQRQAAILQRVNQELCNVNPKNFHDELRSAFQQLVDAMQLQHLSIAARDHGLRQFVVVWIATALMSARVDGSINLADAILFSKNRVCRVGWATEGACIALVSALKAAETDFRRESITDAYGGMVAQYMFSKSLDLKWHPISIEMSMQRFIHVKPRSSSFYCLRRYNFEDHSDFVSNSRYTYVDEGILTEGGRRSCPISSMFWELALESLNSDNLPAFSRAFVALFKCADTDLARGYLSQVIHAHQKVFRDMTVRHVLHHRLGWYQEHNVTIYEWEPTYFHGSAFHVKFLAALVAEGVCEALTHALNSTETNSKRASIALAISALASSVELGREAVCGVASTAACARDALKQALIRAEVSRDDCRFLEAKYFQAQCEHEIIKGALCNMGPYSAAAVQRVNVIVKKCENGFFFHGQHVFSDRSHYQGQWIRKSGDWIRQSSYVLPHPSADDARGALRGHSMYSSFDGKMHGKGTMVYRNGDSYKGEWIEGRKSGRGVYRWKNADFFDGEWGEGKPTLRITRHTLHLNNQAVLLQTSIRCHLSRAAFQKLRATVWFMCRCILQYSAARHISPLLNGYRFKITANQARFFARPLADFIAQAGFAAQQQVMRQLQANFHMRQRAAFPSPWNQTRGITAATRRSLYDVSQSERCRTRCKEVVFIADRLVSDAVYNAASVVPFVIERCLRRFAESIVERVFCGHRRRVLRFLKCRHNDDDGQDFAAKKFDANGMEEVD